MNQEARAIRKHLTPTQARGPAGYFINLDKSVGRRRAIEAELAKVGFPRRYQRFAAIDRGTLKTRNHAIEPGEAGCFLSHLGVIEAGAKTGGHFHVLEDDAVLSRDFAA
jgi:GR25 family glycosyltransferase involved in LPS biosynthesis